MADKINLASVSYTLGILSIVLAFFSSLAGLVLGIIGFIQAKKQKVDRAKKLNLIGIILSAIFFIISLLFIVFAANSGVDVGSFPLF
jgi:Na+/melibiose symporter-like transporter